MVGGSVGGGGGGWSLFGDPWWWLSSAIGVDVAVGTSAGGTLAGGFVFGWGGPGSWRPPLQLPDGGIAARGAASAPHSGSPPWALVVLAWMTAMSPQRCMGASELVVALSVDPGSGGAWPAVVQLAVP